MKSRTMIVFVCEHGAAKSILAAAHFNRLANEQGLNVQAVARGTNPDAAVSEQTLDGLFKDGLEPTEATPQKLSMDDIESAQRIVSFCELPGHYGKNQITEEWQDIPAVSENYEIARNAILERIRHLLDEIRSSS